MRDLGTLSSVTPHKVWPDEARDFTPWLADNIQELGKALNLDLAIERQEADVGDFSLDILARDLSTNHVVVIENQLERTDHDHLGKLLTYAGGFDASVVIWISTSIRDEHRQALEWLNQRSDSETCFVGVVVEVLQIDDSRPAINFKPVVFPNPWKKGKKPSGDGRISEKGEKYRQYFQGLIDILREKHHFTGSKVGQAQNWFAFSSGYPDFCYSTSFVAKNRIRVEVYLDSGLAETNNDNFDCLFSKKEQIAQQFEEPVSWEPMEGRRASRIAVYRDGSIDNDADTLKEIQEWVIDRLLQFKKVFGHGLQSI